MIVNVVLITHEINLLLTHGIIYDGVARSGPAPRHGARPIAGLA
jgi:hypothetical protein